MWLRQLELTNFQKHSYLKLDFTSGVNVLYGATDAGKSCVKRGISWVFFNIPQGDDVRKEGTKKTSVKIIRDNGISVERIKSASVNAYILNIPGEKEKRFDSVGRKIPEEVVKALRTSLIEINGETINLNIADQIALPFLTDKSATFRSKLFNKLTGSEITDKVLQDLNKDILRVSREEKAIKEELDQKEEQEIMLKIETNRLKEAYDNLKKKYDNLEGKKEKYVRVMNIGNKLGCNKHTQEFTKSLLEKGLKDIISTDELRKKQKKLDKLRELESFLYTTNNFLYNVKQQLSTVKDFSKLPINKLKNIWEKLTMLKKTKNKLDQNEVKTKDINSKKERVEKTLTKWITRYKEELKKRDICPTCKQKITEKTIENLKVT